MPKQTFFNLPEGKRQAIIDVAIDEFASNDYRNASISRIAARAGISKVTLYRYFPNRDYMAIEVHARMMERIASLVGPEDRGISLEGVRALVRSMIRSFGQLRDAYRYMGMFDSLYLDHPADAALPEWTKDQLIALIWRGMPPERIARAHPQANQIIMAISTVIWFLEKLALRGELTWSDQAVPLEEHLKSFEDMILGYIDRLGTEMERG